MSGQREVWAPAADFRREHVKKPQAFFTSLLGVVFAAQGIAEILARVPGTLVQQLPREDAIRAENAQQAQERADGHCCRCGAERKGSHQSQ